MSDANAPHQHHSDDAQADDGPPTDALTDEVKADSADTEGAAESADTEGAAESEG